MFFPVIFVSNLEAVLFHLLTFLQIVLPFAGPPTAIEQSPRTYPVIAFYRAISISDVESVSEGHAALIDKSY